MPFPTNLNRIQSSTSGLANAADVGDVYLTQTTTATTVSAGTAVDATLRLPANAQIISILIDTIQEAVVGGGSATAIAATVGIASGGTQYAPSTDVIAGGRFIPTFTTAQLAAMANIGTNTTLYFTVDPNGTVSTTQAIYRLTVNYRQTV